MPDLVIVLIVILVIVVLIRGPKTLPEIGAMLGRGARNMRDELSGKRTDDEAPKDDGPST